MAVAETEANLRSINALDKEINNKELLELEYSTSELNLPLLSETTLQAQILIPIAVGIAFVLMASIREKQNEVAS